MEALIAWILATCGYVALRKPVVAFVRYLSSRDHWLLKMAVCALFAGAAAGAVLWPGLKDRIHDILVVGGTKDESPIHTKPPGPSSPTGAIRGEELEITGAHQIARSGLSKSAQAAILEWVAGAIPAENVYIADAGGFDVRLPAESALPSLQVDLGGKGCGKPYAVSTSAERISDDDLAKVIGNKYGAAELTRWHDGRLGERRLIIRRASPLLEEREIPPRKRRFWDYDAARDPDLISARMSVINDDRAALPHYNIRFDNHRVAVDECLFIIEAEARGLNDCCLSIATGDGFENVIPRAAGERRASFKFSGPLDCMHARPGRSRCPGIDPAHGANCEHIQPEWSGATVLNDDRWHIITQIITVRRAISGVNTWTFRLLLDDEEIGYNERCTDTLPGSFVPEFRNRGCDALQIRRFRVYHVGAIPDERVLADALGNVD